MRFLVTRTSTWGDDKPCDEAQIGEYLRLDERTCDDPSKVPSANGTSEWWYSDGLNHRVVEGRIQRDFVDTAWLIEVSSLENLMEFISKNGDCVIKSPSWRGMAEIEIYDSHRE